MNGVVVGGAIAVAALNAAPGLFGGWLWHQGGPQAQGSARGFWIALRAGQLSALALAIGVGALAAAGRRSGDQLFYLYALLPLAVAFVAEQLRIVSAQMVLERRGLPDAAAVGTLAQDEQRRVVLEIVRREIGVMALSALVVVFLALRAAGTAHGL